MRYATPLTALLLALAALAASAGSECASTGRGGATATGVYTQGFTCMDSKPGRIPELFAQKRTQSHAPQPLRTFSFDGIRVSLDLATYHLERRRRRVRIVTEITITNENPGERLALIVQDKQLQYTHLHFEEEAKPRRGTIQTFHRCVTHCAGTPEDNWTTLLPGVPHTLTYTERLKELPRTARLDIALRLLVKKRGGGAVSVKDLSFTGVAFRPVQEAPAPAPPVRSLSFDSIQIRLEQATMSRTRHAERLFLDLSILNKNRTPVLVLFASDPLGSLRIHGEGKGRTVKSGFFQCGSMKDTLRRCGKHPPEDWALLLPDLPQTFRISTTRQREPPATGTLHLSFRMLYKKEGNGLAKVKDISFSRVSLQGWMPEGQ